jgi:hypothetical protein
LVGVAVAAEAAVLLGVCVALTVAVADGNGVAVSCGARLGVARVAVAGMPVGEAVGVAVA